MHVCRRYRYRALYRTIIVQKYLYNILTWSEKLAPGTASPRRQQKLNIQTFHIYRIKQLEYTVKNGVLF